MRKLAGLSARQRIMIGGAAGLTVLVIAIILVLAVTASTAADDQPIAFNHNIHVVKNEIQCQYCHSGVDKSPVAGIPSVEKCMGCHTHIATESPKIIQLNEYWINQEPIPWVRVNHQPDFVYFNHQSHFAAGVTCGACHGDVKNMTVAEKAVDMTMGFCLDCHAEQENKDALWDCATCHR